MENPYLNKPIIPKSVKKGLLIACAAVLGVILAAILTLVYFATYHNYELCSAEVGDDVVSVCRKGYFPKDSHAIKIKLNGKTLMESDCTGDLFGEPEIRIDVIDVNTAKITGYGDGGVTTVILLVLEDDGQRAEWWLESGDGWYEDLKFNQQYDDSVRAVAKSLSLSHSKPD